MYRSAVRGGLDFYETSSQVKRAVLRGELVALRGNAELRRVERPRAIRAAADQDVRREPRRWLSPRVWRSQWS